MPREIENKRMVLNEGEIGHIFLKKGEKGKSAVLEVRNPENKPFALEQMEPGSPEAQKEELLAEYPDILASIVRNRLRQQSYKLVGGDSESTDMGLNDDQITLIAWMKQVKKLGIPIEEVHRLTTDVLRNSTIDSAKIGFMGPLTKEIDTTIKSLADRIWEVKKPKPRG